MEPHTRDIQTAGRISRQTKVTYCYRLIGADTVEEDRYALCEKKVFTKTCRVSCDLTRSKAEDPTALSVATSCGEERARREALRWGHNCGVGGDGGNTHIFRFWVALAGGSLEP